LPPTGSVTDDVIVAVFVMEPVTEGAVKLIVMTDAAPDARLALVQVTMPALSGQVQPVPLALINVTPVGRVSVTVRPVAVLGPMFVTVTV
jgi:hypothetical protein